MKGYCMDLEVSELKSKLPDGRFVNETLKISESFTAVHVSIQGTEDTVFTHTPSVHDETNVFIGLYFDCDIEDARKLSLCVRSCEASSEYGSEILYEFNNLKKIWDGFYKIQTSNKTYYVKMHV